MSVKNLEEINKERNKKCAPSKKYQDGSCFTFDSLKKIANAYNAKSNISIELENIEKHTLVKELEKKLKDNCDNQVCWIRQDFVKKINSEEIQTGTFKPEGSV